MRIAYGKLVRDGVPEVIRGSGRACATEVLAERDYRRALLEKLVEEAQEAAAAGPDGLPGELADVCEVLDAILEAYAISRPVVQARQAEKRRQRGGFQRRLRLLWVEAADPVGGA
jgi:predicted house-cleaning noncanonical NTP pyrophosphatase (MazG superfamily)